MAYLTKYGTIWGSLPYTTGNTFFVAPVSSSSSDYQIEGNVYTASDDNDGRSPERALATLTQAKINCTANNGDIVVPLPGTHNASTGSRQTTAGNLAFNKAGIRYIGLPFDGLLKPPTIITAPAATIAGSVTAANNGFKNLTILPVTQKTGLDFTTAADGLYVTDCFIDMATPTGHASTKGIAATGATQAPTRITIKNSIFEESNGGTSQGVAIDVGASLAFRVDYNKFYNLGTTASETAWANVIKVNDVAHGVFDTNQCYTLIGGVAITAFITGVSMTGVSVISFYRNIVGVSIGTPFTGFAAADCDLCLNYVATVAGGSGGTLIAATA